MPVDTSVIIHSNRRTAHYNGRGLHIIMAYNYITLIIRLPLIVHYIEPFWHLHKLEWEIHISTADCKQPNAIQETRNKYW